MTAPRSVKVGRVELPLMVDYDVTETWRRGYGDRPHIFVTRYGTGGKFCASLSNEVLQITAWGDSAPLAADALTAKLKQLRAALADVLGDEEATPVVRPSRLPAPPRLEFRREADGELVSDERECECGHSHHRHTRYERRCQVDECDCDAFRDSANEET